MLLTGQVVQSKFKKKRWNLYEPPHLRSGSLFPPVDKFTLVITISKTAS